ncbi:MAG: glycosyltransferase family 39 protein [Kiritimatiellia bacterium]
MKTGNKFTAAMLLLLFTLALAIRLLLIPAEPHIESDGVSYVTSGAKLVAGQGFSGIYAPFYPLLTGLCSLLCPDLELCGRLVSAIFGALLVFPLFFIARWAFGQKVALASCLLAIAYPNLCQFSTAVLSESTYLFLFMLGSGISWAALARKGPAFFLPAGAIWGLAYLTRPEGIGYFLLMAVIVAAKFAMERKWRWVAALFLLAAGFLAVAAPYLVHLRQDTGRWMIGKQSPLNLALGENVGGSLDWGTAFEKCYFGLSDDGTKVGTEMILEKEQGIVAYVLSNPVSIAKRYFINLHLINKYVLPGLAYPLVLVLFAAGIFLGDKTKTRRASVLFLACLPYLAFPLFIVDPRYFLPLVPIIIIWAARGLVEAAAWFAGPAPGAVPIGTAAPPLKPALVEAVLVAALLLSFVPFTFRAFLKGDTRTSIYKEAGAWISSNLPPDAALVCRRPYLPFYSGRRQVVLPFATLDRILKYARYKGAGYLVADETELSERKDALPLLEEDYASQDLGIVQKFRDSSGRRLFIYKLAD